MKPSDIIDRATFRTTFDEFDYVLSAEDILWLGVAAYGESHGNCDPDECAAMMWTWLNRFMLHARRPKVWPSVANLIKNHSQPVNPKWRRTGSFCKGKAQSGDCATSRLKWRDKMADLLNAGEIPDKIVPILTDFVAGRIPEPAGGPWVDFANNKVARNHGTRLYAKGNYYLNPEQVAASPLKTAFQPGTVAVLGVNTSNTGLVVLATGLLAVGAGLLAKYLSENPPTKKKKKN